MYPKLKFVYSKKKDLEIFLGFIETNKYFDKSEDLKIGFFNLFPELKGIEKVETKKVIDKEYQAKNEIIKSSLKKIEKDWEKIASWFYKKCDRIFEGHKWPQGKYIAYATIWGVYPRFLNDKTLSFPYKHKLKNYPLVVIAHEMLHFIFYDYLYKNYPKFKSAKYENQVWKMSEIFNALIQNSKKWQNKFKQKVIIYSNLKPKIKRMGKMLPANFTAKDFVKKWK